MSENYNTSKAVEKIQKANSLDELNSIKNELMGSNSALVKLSKSISTAPATKKAQIGKLVSSVKVLLQEELQKKQSNLEEKEQLAKLESEKVDASLFLTSKEIGAYGSLHPIPALIEKMKKIFLSMGWKISSGPEIETEWFNFDALNFGKDHPARQMQDTFYIKDLPKFYNQKNDEKLVLRTHTSPNQARLLLEQKVPIAVAVFGKVYRSDDLDSTHTPVFHQVEGLVVDKDINISHLKGSMEYLAQTLFGKKLKTRLRPSFFPFTEPSAEMDFQCFACLDDQGKVDSKLVKSCKTCGGTGWIEWGGCGMVHPAVLENCKIDSKKYTGFAFGIGIERTLMFLSGVKDMHDVVDGDIRFSDQFLVGGLR